MIRPAIPRNWSDFQHYRNRRPPWIKLHRAILDDYEFSCLPIASKALAPLLWLIASEGENGTVDVDPGRLAHRLRWTYEEIIQGLEPLIEGGFIILASRAIAPSLHLASPEGEGEGEGEKEERTEVKPDASKAKAKTRRSMETSIPEDFAISDRVKSWASSKGHTRLDEHLEAFIGKAKAKNYRYTEWDEAFMNAIREDWAKLGSSPKATVTNGESSAARKAL